MRTSTLRQARTIAICLALWAFLTGFAGADGEEAAAFSHLAPHLAAEQLSHLGAHRPGLPPPALLLPLGNGVDGVLKGLRPADEARLIDGLVREGLTQQILRVGIAQVAGLRMGLIKLQAGDSGTGAFSLRALQEDAGKCLKAAFAGPLRLDHLDLWAVVPGAGEIGDERENFPVFSCSVDRSRYEFVAERADDAAGLLTRLDAVRYSPVFLRYVGGDGKNALDLPPASAYTEPEVAEQWEALLAEAQSPAASALMALQDEVRVLFHGWRNGTQVALTIDDGPHPLITPLMLAILKQNNVKATFFIVGKKAEEYPALVRMILRGGHEVGNHAYSNRRLHDLATEEAWAAVEACHRIVGRITGERMTYFRPPGGVCSANGLRAVGSLGYTTAFWTRNTGDWRKPPPEEIVHNALTGLEAGDIILMHEGDMCSVRALPRIIKGIRAMGLEPTTLGEIDRNGSALRDTPEALTELVNSQISGEE